MSHPLPDNDRAMNPQLTEIAFALDRSGSMSTMLEAAISGFNHFLRDQQQAPGQARLTLVLFDDCYEVPVAALPIAEVTALDTTTFVPRGCTALLDAIGRTIDELGQRLAATPEADRPGKVIVAILTDGFENASRHFTWQAVHDRIRHQRDHYAWEFLFLGANQDAIATAAQIGIAAHMSATFAADHVGQMSADKALSRKVRSLRAHAAGQDGTAEAADLAAPLDSIVQEEDRKERGA